MTAPATSYFERHPIIAGLVCWMVFFILFFACSEIGLRLFLNYKPNYYTGSRSALKNRQETIEYPWGKIYINSDGYPDSEFKKVKTAKRVAYVGDSVCFGIGAGYSYRISEYLEKQFPQFEHMNFGYASDGVPSTHILDLSEQYQFDKVIYLMNMNDILPTVHSAANDIPMRGEVHLFVTQFDWLRDQSYVYNFVRFTLKNLLLSMGYEVHGEVAYERFPSQHREVIQETVARIKTFRDELKKQHTDLVVVILPYEMQISEAAAQAYHQRGIQWDPDFTARSTQKMLEAGLQKDGIDFVDGYWAFVHPGHEEADRLKNGLGEYYVFNKGDKLDWNHMNRLGQRVMAEYLAKTIRWE